MKIAISILLTIIILLTLSGCDKDMPESEPIEPATSQVDNSLSSPSPTTSPKPAPETWDGDMKGFASEYEMTNWSWAIPDWEAETPTDALVGIEYASPDNLEELTLAVGPAGMLNIKFDGNKEGNDDFSWPFYHARFNSVTGPVWKSTDEVISSDRYFYDYLLLPASSREKIIALTYPTTTPNYDDDSPFFNHGHPQADPSDIAIMEDHRNGRKVIHSELLATSSDGGRISLFQFENIYYGLTVLAYINGDKIVTYEFINHLDNDGKVRWGSESMPDSIDLIEIAVLYQSDAGLVIGFTMYGLEAHGRRLLAERDGKFLDFNFGYWEYIWYTANGSEFMQNTSGVFDYEAWPNMDPAELYGKWTGEYELTFNADGTGIWRAPNEEDTPINYSIDGNLLIIINDDYYNEIYYIKIEENKLYIDMRSWDGKCHILTRNN